MKNKFLIALLILFGSTVCSSYAQPLVRHDARKCLRRTGMVIFQTQKIVKEGKVYNGDFAKAVVHQRFAKKLFLKGKYVRAIHQSVYARKLAFRSIAINKAVIKAEWKMDQDELKYEKSTPSDKSLDSEAGTVTLSDEDLLNVDIADIDLPESDK